ncbi:MAG: transcriptional regulator NrdR [Actinomycetota bacterium]
MRCPWCGHEEDRVVDSRSVEEGSAVRRRRECLSCKRRYTTFERVEALGLTVIKRDGAKEPYSREKLVSGLEKALTNRPVDEERITSVASKVEARLRKKGPQVTSQDVGLEVLSELRKVDHVGYMRFASVYKDFQEVSDFERELGMLLQKRQPSKKR